MNLNSGVGPAEQAAAAAVVRLRGAMSGGVMEFDMVETQTQLGRVQPVRTP